jgi:hypothetical protein
MLDGLRQRLRESEGKFQVNCLNYRSLALKRLASARETVHLTGETISNIS